MRHSPGELPLVAWLIISALFHGLFIGGAELLGPESAAQPDYESLQAQYRLHETGDPAADSGIGSPGDNSAGDEDSPALSISFETSDPKYKPYFRRLRDKIGMHWAQPRLGEGEEDKGSLLVEFVLGKKGDLRAVSVARSSGVMGLDFAAMEAVKSAANYAPFPPEITEKELKIRALFIYD